MTDELKVLYNQVKDWATWDPPGGRSWYDSVTDPDPKEGLLVQLQLIVDKFKNCLEIGKTTNDKFTKVYQLSRKMREDADELEKRMAGNIYIQQLVDAIEDAVLKKCPEMNGIYSLNTFIAMQKIYLDQITFYFHDAVEKDKSIKMLSDRLAFYENIMKICSYHIDVTRAVHIFNKIEPRLKKTAAKEYVKCVNGLLEALAGWEMTNIEKRFEVAEMTSKVVTQIFGSDIDKQFVERGIVQHLQRILMKAKDYLKISKDLKRRIHNDREFWKRDASELIIHDGCEEPKK